MLVWTPPSEARNQKLLKNSRIYPEMSESARSVQDLLKYLKNPGLKKPSKTAVKRSEKVSVEFQTVFKTGPEGVQTNIKNSLDILKKVLEKPWVLKKFDKCHGL